mmetsp:Transcript_1718/g.3846  ORF Transcript_1718/g.3846 Transcript_1718/m.3846 type:complete len:297 (+) Transcript_1718:446-1336(+)|eukprot:CAMPEP_0168185186 /NCGR_PEP_ID=MMETSP0139_2-20121125/13691_1 /TAXON_ID=44445 /ORGANISM="Pseudo-nitzschia australis, Strain 10249 10 AB" /LENGTH=296 /DNA_ID=CAMNT_0008106963 /DNA_START=370 /DNA_END=1260 /DNA_ORIENTATION=+
MTASFLVKMTMIQEVIAKLTLNNVKKRNALSYAMLEQIQTNLNTIETNPDIRVVIINANGPVFSSGHDLQEIQTNSVDANCSNCNDCNDGAGNNSLLMELSSSVMQTIVQLNKPVIAQVEGVATAAGCQLIASCDLAYASTTAWFATPGVNLGLFCSTPGVALGRCMHRKHAMHMLLTGDMISAKKAKEIGLINDVIGTEKNNYDVNNNSNNNCDGKENIDDAVLEIAAKIASKPSRAIELGKPLFYEQLELPLDAAYRLTSNAMTDHMNHDEEAKEGIDAFLTKRTPNWPSSKDS